MAGFDVKRVSPLEWAGIGAGLVALIASFLPWYSVEVSGFGSESLSAWNSGALAWFPVLLLVIVAGLIVATQLGTQVGRLRTAWLAMAALAVLLIVIRWLTLPDDGGLGDLSLLGDTGIESGAGFGLILGLLAAVVSLAAAVMAFRSAPRSAPNTTVA